MGAPLYGAVLLFLVLSAATADVVPEQQQKQPALPSSPSAAGGAGNNNSSTVGVNSNSVLVALLDSHYTELAELVEKALLLQSLEDAVGRGNVTIFAPRNEALERDLDPEFRAFLLEPRNLRSLQRLLLYHVLPSRLHSASGVWPAAGAARMTLSGEHLELSADGDSRMLVGAAAVTKPDAVVRPDGVIHGIERLLVPRSVQEDFNRRRSLAAISAVLPTGAPEVDPRTHRLKKPAPPVPLGAPPVLPVWDAMAPGPSIAPAPAPGPNSGKAHFDGHSQVKDFIQTLVLYGGYNELADILVNLTSLATEMGRLVSEGYVLTVLAPNDEAMARLTTDQLSEPGSPENILYYHMVPEYQTEESMYNAVRRFGTVRYDTLRLPQKVTAREADGSVKFGHGEGSAYLFDPDIYTDGRISVQGIDAVLFPPVDDTAKSGSTGAAPARKAPAVTGTAKSKLRRAGVSPSLPALLVAFAIAGNASKEGRPHLAGVNYPVEFHVEPLGGQKDKSFQWSRRDLVVKLRAVTWYTKRTAYQMPMNGIFTEARHSIGTVRREVGETACVRARTAMCGETASSELCIDIDGSEAS